MKSLLEYIKISMKNVVNEGGAAVSADPIPAYIAPKVYEEVRNKMLKTAKVQMVPLGSLGKKKDDDFTGDIDIAVDFKSKDDLIEAVKKAFPDNERNDNTFPNIVSISYHYNIDGVSGNAQVDFMIVKDMNWAKFRYSSPNFRTGESKYKAAVRSQLCSIIVSEIPFDGAKEEYFDDGITIKRKWKYTFNTEGVFKQLLDYTSKSGKPKKNPTKLKEFEQLVTNDPVNFIKFMFGENGKISDYNSAESLWKAIHDPSKFKWQDKVPTIEKRFFDECDVAKPEDFPTSVKESSLMNESKLPEVGKTAWDYNGTPVEIVSIYQDGDLDNFVDMYDSAGVMKDEIDYFRRDIKRGKIVIVAVKRLDDTDNSTAVYVWGDEGVSYDNK